MTQSMVSQVDSIPVPSSLWRVLSEVRSRKKLPKGLDFAWEMAGAVVQQWVPRRRRMLRRAARIVAMEDQFAEVDDAALQEQIDLQRELFRRGRETSADVDRAFALVREAARRRLGLHPRPNQVAAAATMESGCLAELATGEGKTLAATLPAVLAGWRGRGCHVVTVNDYLAKRDAEEMGPLYRFCRLRVGYIEEETPPEDRRDAYAADITYCTNKSVTADFLRDRLVLGQLRSLPQALLAKHAAGAGVQRVDRLVMRGMEFAIVDEADSLLVDESVTPLIISGDSPNPEQVEAYGEAAALAAQLSAGSDYQVNHRYREVELTRRGREHIADLTEQLGGVWSGARRREELVNQAVSARELYTSGREYVIDPDEQKVVIIDEFTGRLMPDRTWRDGFHQAVEAKEGLEIQPPKSTLARISFQRFFRLYRKLSGMTGTAWENRREFWQVYRLPVVRLPTYRPCIRRYSADRVFTKADDKWRDVVDYISSVHDSGRPVLVGTRSVEASERLSGLLTERGLDHNVLNAVRYEEEARIVAEAGQADRITVATNMAGRGTDIKLSEGVADMGGLCVIATERHEAGRIDRQLFGRCARQGDPGSAVAFVSFEDDLIRRHGVRGAGRAARGRARFTWAQQNAERRARRMRNNVLRQDDWLDEHLGFAGIED